MIAKFFTVSACATMALFGSAFAQIGPVYFDVDKAIELHGVTLSDADQRALRDIQNEITAATQKGQRLTKQIEAGRSALTDAQLRSLQEELDATEAEFESLKQQYAKKLYVAQEAEKNKLYRKLEDAAVTYANNHDLSQITLHSSGDKADEVIVINRDYEISWRIARGITVAPEELNTAPSRPPVIKYARIDALVYEAGYLNDFGQQITVLTDQYRADLGVIDSEDRLLYQDMENLTLPNEVKQRSAKTLENNMQRRKLLEKLYQHEQTDLTAELRQKFIAIAERVLSENSNALPGVDVLIIYDDQNQAVSRPFLADMTYDVTNSLGVVMKAARQ